MTNKLRIIGGEWRSRIIVFDDAPGLRPTPGRVRETLFNWLQSDIVGSRCLDLYAGSGALGFEAASRGAKRVMQVESNAKTCQTLRQNIVALRAEQIEVMQDDVGRFLLKQSEKFDLVFLDPPFALDLAVSTCSTLEQQDWLAPHAKIYVETERQLSLDNMPPNWRLLKHKAAGEVGYALFQRQ